MGNIVLYQYPLFLISALSNHLCTISIMIMHSSLSSIYELNTIQMYCHL